MMLTPLILHFIFIATNFFVAIIEGESSVTFYKENVTYTDGEINERLSAVSMLQCVVRCYHVTECAAIEYRPTEAQCLILSSVVEATGAANYPQFIKNQAKQCADEWERYGGQCYYITDNAVDRPKCSEICFFYGGTLATDNSKDLSDFINKFKSGKGVWIGGLEYGTEGSWDSGATMSYSNWLPGEPDSELDSCIMYSENSLGWEDAPCQSPQRCLCERYDSIIPE
ncbi:hypothetical protein ACF0H5_021851 [Mactra antiquata]